MAFQVYSYALTTRQKVKDLAGITDSNSDTIIDQLINAWTDFAESYCGGRRFMSTSYVEIYDALENSNKVFLNQRPCTAISLVEYRTGVPSNPTWTTYNADSYMSYLKSGYVHLFGRFSWMPQAFRVTYVAGYLINWTNEGDGVTHTLPADLTYAITEIIAKKLNGRNALGISSETTEGQSVTYGASMNDLSTDQQNVLDGYKSYRYAV